MPEQETQSASEDKDKFIAVSRPMLTVLRRLERASKRDVSIFLYGQTGTGKSMLAKWIHQKSHRSNCPYVAVSCAAIPESLIESQLFGHERGSFTGANQKRIGLFERAQNGTLFLDEIGDASPEVQKKLLRALQERTIERIGGAGKPIPISARIISATNKNLPEEIKKDAFREDLYQRLKAVAFRIPPLRKRRKDLPLLIEAFAEKYAEGGKPVQFSQEALSILFMLRVPWKCSGSGKCDYMRVDICGGRRRSPRASAGRDEAERRRRQRRDRSSPIGRPERRGRRADEPARRDKAAGADDD
ncbi:MAG: sigma 54-interacting transcriptional regulator [Candidatus Poribacteria bacterium]|nr:sigma 54-interacting transcriptional regulator [Candidatus Poribacteria bacterium]